MNCFIYMNSINFFLHFPQVLDPIYGISNLLRVKLKSKSTETCIKYSVTVNFFLQLNQTLSKPKTCLNQTNFTVPSTKCLCNLNLCKPNTCLNRTNSSVPKRFCFTVVYIYTPSSILFFCLIEMSPHKLNFVNPLIM